MRIMNLTMKSLIALLLLAGFWGCSTSNKDGIILDATGKHPSEWVAKHSDFFRRQAGATDDPAIARSSVCVECHGTDLKGGTSKVSCFSQGFGAQSCHFHPAGYRDPGQHGAVAKSVPSFSSGLDSCRGCHGSQFASGVLSKTSCFAPSSLADPAFACHGVGAPHAKDWAISETRRHSSTAPDNAAACALCHLGGKLLTHLPAPPDQPAGTAPGCFNNTLCHSGLHPDGWIDPAQHGVAAKSEPGSNLGFASCQVCHGKDFTGSASGVSCFSASSANGNCHVRNGLPVNAPHAALPWRAASPIPTHTSTVDDAAGLNAGVCAQCHLRGANLRTPIITSYASTTPGCFNSTLCHDRVGHPTGWADPAQHGATAKANLLFCQGCHSSSPSGGPGSNPRFNVVLGRLTAGCETCHEPNYAHPPVLQIPAAFGITSPDPLDTPWFRHRTATNFDACNRCHGINLTGGVGPRCQNCHLAALPTSTINNPDPCSSCHSRPPSGTAYPNINRSHGRIAATVNVPSANLCQECHSGLGSGTLDHFLRARNIRLGTIIPATQTKAQPGAIVFGGILSKAKGASPTFDETTLACDNTYCHGVTLVGGANKSPRWDQTDYLAAAGCGTCHGFPPANAAHNGLTSATLCAGCHSSVNSSNNGFVDPSKHINGTIDVTGAAHSVPFFTHNASAANSCLKSGSGCHNIGTGGVAAANQYPLAKDSATGAPDCMSCHTLANPLLAGNGLGNCRSCHGTGGTGTLAAPTGTTWPNIRGTNTSARHPNHQGALCGTCHPGVDNTGRSTSGAAGSGAGVNHGPNKNRLSGNTQTNSAQVVVGITPNAARGTGSTCLHSSLPNNLCHNGPGQQVWTTP